MHDVTFGQVFRRFLCFPLQYHLQLHSAAGFTPDHFACIHVSANMFPAVLHAQISLYFAMKVLLADFEGTRD